MFKKLSSHPTPADNQARQLSVQAQPGQVVEPPQQPTQPVQTAVPEPMDTSFPQAASAIRKRLRDQRLSLYHSLYLLLLYLSCNLNLSPSSKDSRRVTMALKENFLTCQHLVSIAKSEQENLAPPPKADFHAFIDRVRQYLGIDNPAKAED